MNQNSPHVNKINKQIDSSADKGYVSNAVFSQDSPPPDEQQDSEQFKTFKQRNRKDKTPSSSVKATQIKMKKTKKSNKAT